MKPLTSISKTRNCETKLMRKLYCFVFKKLALIFLSICLCLPVYLKSRLPLKTVEIRIEDVEIATKYTSVDLGTWSATQLYPKLPNTKKQMLEFNGKEMRTEDNGRATETVHGVFFNCNAENKIYTESTPWLTVYPARGRLGNQMFQLASLVGIAYKFGFKPFIPLTSFDINLTFDISKLETTSVDINKFNKYQEGGVRTFAERDISRYTDLSFLTAKANWSLDGYLQSYKYFADVRNDILRLFTFKGNIIEQVKNLVESTTVPGSVKVGIHVRRGDFLSDYHVSLGRVIPELDYYRRAMNFFKTEYTNITFFVVSNDIPWCKGNLQNNQEKMVFSAYTNPGYDLAIMSQCDHMIMSVGTFSWWGAWLAGGSVVYFNGYPKPGSEISKYFVKEDFYPPSWTGMS